MAGLNLEVHVPIESRWGQAMMGSSFAFSFLFVIEVWSFESIKGKGSEFVDVDVESNA